jgi:hypothetical protein
MTRREEPIPALSAGLSHVALTGLFLALAFLPHRPEPFAPSGDLAALPRPPVTAPAESTPKPGAPVAPPAGVEQAAIVEQWPEDEIARAKEQCMHLLSSTAAEIEYLEPVKKGTCGLPAPIRLKSLGAGESKVVFNPPVQVNCRMVAALGAWMKASVQPVAQERFKSRVTGVLRASGYSCRNIYNLPNARLSQHALANAIDIGGFALANGRTVNVLSGWGLTERDIAARAKAKALAKAKADKAGKGAKEADGKDGKDAKGAKADADAKGDGDKSREAAKDAKTAEAGSKSKAAALLDKAGIARASLGPSGLGKKPAGGAESDGKPDVPAKPTRDALFLRDIHGGACRQFGTVLGPEANEPHRNHFHLDLISRQNRGYCH